MAAACQHTVCCRRSLSRVLSFCNPYRSRAISVEAMPFLVYLSVSCESFWIVKNGINWIEIQMVSSLKEMTYGMAVAPFPFHPNYCLNKGCKVWSLLIDFYKSPIFFGNNSKAHVSSVKRKTLDRCPYSKAWYVHSNGIDHAMIPVKLHSVRGHSNGA